MANVDLTTSDYRGNFSVKREVSGSGQVLYSRKFDCSSLNLLSANTYDIFTVDANLIPTEVIISVNTAEGGAATLDVGDEDSVTRFETDANMNATGITSTLDATKEYTAEKKIRIQPSADLDTAVFSISILCIEVESDLST